MAPVIGIDLGTTNTVVAVVTDGHAQTIVDESGQSLIPSVVSFDPNGNVLVGRAAKERRMLDAANTIYSVKRLIGRSWDTEEVRRARSRFAFQMLEGPGQATLVVGRGETYTLPEISAFVLRKAKQVAEAALRTRVERAVITVPANFNDLQRAATKVAGRVAGLEVLRILNEPTAAALAYGFGKDNSERLAVYDFGGGTFDVTLLDLSENVFEVLATAGNTFLGGDDIDHAIADRIAADFLDRHRYDPRSDPQAFERLRAAAELIKLRLSDDEVVTLLIDDISRGPLGRALSIEFSLTRAEFERIAAPIVDRTFDVCREALGIARREAEEFEQILLVGGSTRIPLVKARVEEFFGREVKASVTPDEAVALGAAIQASALSGAERRQATIPPAPAAARRTMPSGSPADEGRYGMMPAVVLPSTRIPSSQPFGPRPHMPTMPGVAPAPRAEQAFLERKAGISHVFEPARHARDEASAMLPIVEPDPESPPREDSVAFAIRDHEIEEITSVPPRFQKARPGPPENTATDWLQGNLSSYPPDEITQRRELAEEEPTKAGRTSNLAMEQEEPTLRRPPTKGPSPTAPTAFGSLLDFLPPPQPIRFEDRPTPTSIAPPATPIVPRQQSFPAAPNRSPLLVDVTPLTLSVETVQGYCDPVIERNTTVPCEQFREFATAVDNQTSVKVRIAQGESSRFEQNTLLGEVELAGLPPAPRGSVQISVIFALDANGMLNVSAVESASRRAATVQLRLLGLPSNDEIAHMTARHAQHPSL